MPPSSVESLKGLGQGLLSLLFPPRCVGCGKPGHELCPSCIAEFKPVGDSICTICGELLDNGPGMCRTCRANRPLFSRVRSAYRYEGRIREAIHKLKYEQRRAVAAPLAAEIARVLGTPDPAWEAICAVPLHPERETERGYNQSALLAKELAQRWNLPYLASKALRRVRATTSQVELNYAARQENVRGAFEADDQLVSGLHILLVDDVCTTGATLNACAGALLSAGAVSVGGITLARAIFGDNKQS